jgi:hypothetical protein
MSLLVGGRAGQGAGASLLAACLATYTTTRRLAMLNMVDPTLLNHRSSSCPVIPAFGHRVVVCRLSWRSIHDDAHSLCRSRATWLVTSPHQQRFHSRQGPSLSFRRCFPPHRPLLATAAAAAILVPAHRLVDRFFVHEKPTPFPRFRTARACCNLQAWKLLWSFEHCASGKRVVATAAL